MENKQLNRLNVNESRIWDRCFRYFIKTGEWPMGMTDGIHLDIEDQPERKSGRNFPDVKAAAKSISKLTDEMLEEMDKNPSPFVAPMVNGLLNKTDEDK